MMSAAAPRGRRIRGVPTWAVAGMHTGGPGMHTVVFVIPGIHLQIDLTDEITP